MIGSLLPISAGMVACHSGVSLDLRGFLSCAGQFQIHVNPASSDTERVKAIKTEQKIFWLCNSILYPTTLAIIIISISIL